MGSQLDSDDREKGRPRIAQDARTASVQGRDNLLLNIQQVRHTAATALPGKSSNH
jgi:hypothetical protein